MMIPRRVRRVIDNLIGILRGDAQPPLGCGPLDLERPWSMAFAETCSELDVLYCFRLILGRLPGKPEWPGHRGLAGGELTEVVKSYLSSKEFADRRLLLPQVVEYALVEMNGYAMYVPPQDSEVGRHIYGSKSYEPNVTAAIRRHLAPGMTFIDIGANIGYYALMASYVVGELGSVLAFEPNSNNVRFIIASALANRFSNLRVYPFAVCDSATLLGYSNMGTNGVISQLRDDSDAFAVSTLVYGVGLDSLLQSLDRIDIVKIDVEGAEYVALKGARKILEQHRPLIFSEFSPYALEAVSKVSGLTYLEYLVEDCGYRISVIDPEGNLVDYARDVEGVVAFFDLIGSDHIDLVARP